MSERIAFYRCDEPVEAKNLPEGYSLEVWRPGFKPAGGGKTTIVFWLLHTLRVFANRDYSAIQVRHNGEVAHTSYVIPGFFRFPFMSRSDLQVGDTWTDERHRGKGLATAALTYVASGVYGDDHRTWYLTDAGNAASVKTVEKSGFKLVGYGRKAPRFGILFLGYYEIVEDSE